MMTRARRCLLVVAVAMLSSASPAFAQALQVSFVPRASVGGLLVFGADRGLGNGGFWELTSGSSTAPGLWADVTVVRWPNVGLHVGLETQGWIDHSVFFDRGLGFGGGTDGTFQHKDYALSSYFSFHPGLDRIRPVFLLGAVRARSHYFVFDPGSNQIRRREEYVAAPGLLVGVELPVNPRQRVTFTTRFEARIVAWLPEVSDDGLSAVSVIVGAGVQFRLR